MFLRNNLIMGRGTTRRVFSLDTLTNYSSSDYIGFRPNPEPKEAFAWSPPPFKLVRDYYPAHKPRARPLAYRLNRASSRH